MCAYVEHFKRSWGGGKMSRRIIVLIGNDYFNDKKYSGPIFLGDYIEKVSVWTHKTMFSVHER